MAIEWVRDERGSYVSKGQLERLTEISELLKELTSADRVEFSYTDKSEGFKIYKGGLVFRLDTCSTSIDGAWITLKKVENKPT